MKRALVVAALIGLAVAPLVAGGKGTVNGAYVEARTAEVFTGGCIMGSEAETMGKQAVLAWKVDRGSGYRIFLSMPGSSAMTGNACCCIGFLLGMSHCAFGPPQACISSEMSARQMKLRWQPGLSRPCIWKNNLNGSLDF